MLLIRPSNAGDLQYLHDIEIKSYGQPWLGDEFTGFGRSTFVGTEDLRVIGYYCIRYSANSTRLLRLAISPRWRRMGLGSALMAHVKRGGGSKITTIVSELNEGAIAFLHDTDFRCVNVMKDAFKDSGDSYDGFYFLWRTNG